MGTSVLRSKGRVTTKDKAPSPPMGGRWGERKEGGRRERSREEWILILGKVCTRQG